MCCSLRQEEDQRNEDKRRGSLVASCMTSLTVVRGCLQLSYQEEEEDLSSLQITTSLSLLVLANDFVSDFWQEEDEDLKTFSPLFKT